ncbi:MAG: anthranilate synthase component I [Aquificae bacterium]|nr:anthranilate synthase component I [Aquificota bacterium]
MRLNLDEEKLARLAERYTVVPLYTELLADTETPLSLFLKLKEPGRFAALLESAEGGEQWGRYSFVILGSSFYVRTRKSFGETYDRGRVEFFSTDDPLGKVREILKRFKPYPEPALPRFWGGLVGYVGYDVIKFYEPVPDENPDPISTYDLYMFLTDLVAIHDNLTGTVKLVVPLFPERGVKEELERGVEEIRRALRRVKEREVPFLNLELREPELSAWRSNFTKEGFIEAVKRAKTYIEQGDVIQVVLSQRFKKPFKGKPENVYRVLRLLNPSPYMYYLDFNELKVIGSSPEVLVRLEEGKIATRPIAGTRRRGRTPEEDLKLERELLADEKERAEHLMLVDLARNDLGRVAKKGTVKVTDFMRVERYSHVMHIVSDVEAVISEDKDATDLLKAVFPAGTVTGAPKVRAMQIIEELEPERRGIYAGSVGYFSFQGNADMAIAIRTAVYRDGEVFVQAGAGVVADSVPEKEWEETVNKAKALMKAVQTAEASYEE